MNEFFQWLASLFRGAKFWIIVLPWERGVRVRLGKWTVLWEPGFHWRIPYLDEIRIINTRVRIAPVPMLSVTTPDGKVVTMAGCVAFRIADPYKVLLTVAQPEDIVAALGQAAFASYVVRTDSTKLSIQDMEQAALDEILQARMDGIAFDYVKAVDFAIVRTFRLLMEQYRPTTGYSNLEPQK